MSVLIETSPGYAIALPAVLDAPFPLAIEGLQAPYIQARSILTSLGLARDVKLQLTETMSDSIYIYVFGEQPGTMEISGLSFAGDCTSFSSTGIELLHEFYEANNAARRPTPIGVQIGPSPTGQFQGLLRGIRMGIVDPESRLSKFTLHFQTFPKS